MKSLVFENEYQRPNSSSLVAFILSISFISFGNIQLLIAVFPYIFKQSTINKLIYILPTILLYWLNTKVFVQYVMFIVLYFALSYLLRLYKVNSNKIIQAYLGVYSFVMALYGMQHINIAIIYLVFQILLYNEFIKSYESNQYQVITIFIILNILIFIMQSMPMYYELFIFAGIILICFIGNPLLSIICLLFLNIYGHVIPYEIFIYLLIISQLKDELALSIIMFASMYFMNIVTLYELLIMIICFMIAVLFKKDKIVEEEIKAFNIHSTFNKQLHNFSLIFEHLSTYYENGVNMESEFFKSMSNALEMISKKRIQDDTSVNHLRNKVISILEGYNIGYEELKIEMEEDGFIRLECKTTNLIKKDIYHVLLPLLNKILPTQMQCNSIKKSIFEWGVLNVKFVSCKPMQIDAYADSAQYHETCGDSFSIFSHSNNLYCLISDGMGRGIQASKISKCIVHLFQRMIFSNIHEIEAMNCINKLLLSDSYATCDILIFNRFKKTVHICKSAANPTYLYRNNEMYEIRGNSLPIGIVAHIDVNHLVIQVEEGDLFIMSSDGVNLDEIVEWVRGYQKGSSRKETERFIEYLNRTDRKDDSTILLAKVV